MIMSLFQVGLAYFDTKEDAITALVLVNHRDVEVIFLFVRGISEHLCIRESI